LSLPLQLFSIGSLHIQSAWLGLRAIVNFHPATPNVASRRRRHLNHVLSLLLPCACLRGWNWFQIKIQLRRLVRFGLRICNGRLHGAIHG
jgi:hypothetical protein